MKYILDENRKVIPATLETWAVWFNDTAKRRVDDTTIDGVRVSTVFLGIGGFDGKHDLFETMIFGGDHDEYCARCDTWEEAEAQHAAAIALVKGVTQ